MQLHTFVTQKHAAVIRKLATRPTAKAFYAPALFVMLAGLPPAIAQADTPDQEWANWQARQQQDFQQFKDARDQAFMGYLEQQWKAFELFKANVRDDTPKMSTPPVAKHSLESRPSARQTPAQTDDASRVTAKNPDRLYNTVTEKGLTFFGHEIERFWTTLPDLPLLSSPDQKQLASFWQILSQSEYDSLIKGFRLAQDRLGLGDWSSLLLAQEVARALLTNPNQQAAFCWFLLTKAGLDVRVAFDSQAVYLLTGTSDKIYGHPYLTLSGKTYYVTSQLPVGKLYSYPENNAYHNSPLHFNFARVMRESSAIQTRLLASGDEDAPPLRINYDAGITSALATYPQLDLQSYFSASPNPATQASLRVNLTQFLTGMPARDAVNYLLHFVQQRFPYARDEEQFGEENYLTVEESLYYPYSDCEDRSVLLAWLIRDLLHLKVVALDFPGHVAIAVKLQPQPGDWAAKLKGEHYVIADPTYIGADAGMAMPSMQSKRPKVIYF